MNYIHANTPPYSEANRWYCPGYIDGRSRAVVLSLLEYHSPHGVGLDMLFVMIYLSANLVVCRPFEFTFVDLEYKFEGMLGYKRFSTIRCLDLC